MVAGDQWELYIPSELGYGEDGSAPDIGGGDVLVFTLHMLKINGATKPALRRGGMGGRGGKARGGTGARGGKRDTTAGGKEEF
mgnify:CR=1 FL=1